MKPRIIGDTIEKMDKNYPLTSKENLIELLKEWIEKSNGNTIGNLNGRKSNPTPWLWIKINDDLYKMNADTKRHGIEKFLENHKNKNPWRIIKNQRGRINTITNKKDGNRIVGLYFYAKEERQNEIDI